MHNTNTLIPAPAAAATRHNIGCATNTPPRHHTGVTSSTWIVMTMSWQIHVMNLWTAEGPHHLHPKGDAPAGPAPCTAQTVATRRGERAGGAAGRATCNAIVERSERVCAAGGRRGGWWGTGSGGVSCVALSVGGVSTPPGLAKHAHMTTGCGQTTPLCNPLVSNSCALPSAPHSPDKQSAVPASPGSRPHLLSPHRCPTRRGSGSFIFPVLSQAGQQRRARGRVWACTTWDG